jgi:hypothetical protein
MAVQRDNEQINDELLVVDEEVNGATDTGGGHPVTIGDCDMEAWRGVGCRWSQHTVISEMKECMDPESTSTVTVAGLMQMARHMVATGKMPVMALREMRGSSRSGANNSFVSSIGRR